MNWMIGIFSLFGVVAASNYSYPRILIIGPHGVGKSSIGNVLAGCTPSNKSCFFPVCDDSDSCTKETTLAETTFLGQLAGANTDILDGNVTLIDSPGFGASDLDGPTLIAEMIDVLKNNLEAANTILLCFKQGRHTEDDIDEGIQNIQKMIIQLESIFGRDLWSNVILEITWWAYDKKSISDRKRHNITEAGTLAYINRKLQEHFHLNHSLPGVFIDSNAVNYIDEDTEEYDEVQKQYFFNYSLTLWEAANAMEPFSFFTIDDILNQLHTCQIKNDCLNQVLEERINNIENNVNNINSTVTNNIIELTNDVADNAHNIGTNTNKIDTNTHSIDSNTHNIDSNANKIDTNTHSIGSNTNKIDTNTHSIGSNMHNIDSNANKTDTNTYNIGSNTNKIDTNTHSIGSNTNKIDINTHSIGSNMHNIDSNANKTDTNTHNIGTNTNKIDTNTHSIDSNTNKIDTNTHNIGSNTHNIDSNANKIDTNTHNIGTNTNKIDTNTDDIATNKETISTLTETTSRFVSYCGYRSITTSNYGPVTYEKLVTDVNSFSVGGLDIGTGVFTAPTQGTYLVTQNFGTYGAGHFTVYIIKNGKFLGEGISESSSGDEDEDQTGRTLTLQLATNDKLYLHVTHNDNYIQWITFCISLLK